MSRTATLYTGMMYWGYIVGLAHDETYHFGQIILANKKARVKCKSTTLERRIERFVNGHCEKRGGGNYNKMKISITLEKQFRIRHQNIISLTVDVIRVVFILESRNFSWVFKAHM